MFRTSVDTIRVPEKEVVYPNKCYNCDLCEEGGWTSESDVEIHRKKVHKLKLLELLRQGEHMCTVCLRQQSNLISLIKHIKTHHLLTPANSSRIEREIFICDVCNNLFFNKKLLIAHLHLSHAPKDRRKITRVECPKCFKMVKGNSFWFHLIYHNVLTVSTCPICLEYFEDNERMLQHVKTHNGYYYCNICNDSTNREQYFNNHIKRHCNKILDANKKEQKVSQFFLPGKKIYTYFPKISHLLKGVPMATLIQVCVMCRAMCLSKEEMRQHIFGEHAPKREEKPKMHICVCGEVFAINVLLKHHVFKLKGEHRALEDNEIPNRSVADPLSMIDTFVVEQNNIVNVEFLSNNDISVEEIHPTMPMIKGEQSSIVDVEFLSHTASDDS